MDRKSVREIFLAKSAFLFDGEKAREELLQKWNGCNFLVCEEELSGNIHTGGHHGFLSKGIAERIYDSFPDAEIVIFIRNQPDIIASVYKQYVSMGGTHLPHRYLHHPGVKPHRQPVFNFDHFKYWNLINYYLELFGREQIHVFPYEKFVKDKDCFLQQFQKELNLEVDLSRVNISKHENPSYSPQLLPLARFLNKFTVRDVHHKMTWVHIPGAYQITRKVLSLLNSYWVQRESKDGRTTILDREDLALISNYYRSSNERLNKELHLDLDEQNYPL